MSDTKMLQAIIDSQAGIRKQLEDTQRILREDIKRVETKVEENGERLDKIGSSVAYLEDDTPTIEEFNKHLRRVSKLENQVFEN